MAGYGWAIVEVMGHTIHAGKISNRAFDDQRGMLHIIVPETPENAAYEKRYGVDSIFCITPCSESVAIRAAEVIHRNRVHRSIPRSLHDPHGLSQVTDPMEEIDLEAVRQAQDAAGVPF